MHKNSLKSLVTALYDGDAISKEDLEELSNFVDEVSKSWDDFIICCQHGCHIW